VQDPGGASFALWQPNRHPGAQLFNAPGSMCWNELATRDVDEAKRFYSALLGWEFAGVRLPNFEYTVIQAGGRDGGGVIPMLGPDWKETPPYWNTYFSIADLDAALATITTTGGKLLFGPREAADAGRFAVVCDPQGAVFTVMQLTQPGE
jgi:predicted enzyme related to lactoylglutathione lyase